MPFGGVTVILIVSASLPRRASALRAALLRVTVNLAVPAFAVLVTLPTRTRARPLRRSADGLASTLTLSREPARATAIEPFTACPRWLRASFS